MGNKVCCKPTTDNEKSNELHSYEDYNPEIIPSVSQQIEKLLKEKKPFEDQLKAEPVITTRNYGDEVYVGPVDELNRPEGYGKMYKEKGALVISHFEKGVSNGPSFFAFPDGSYYEGELRNNKAEDQNGFYCSSAVKYRGGFKNNAFSGHGKEDGQNYSYQGTFEEGKRRKGVLNWKNEKNEEFKFDGIFDENGNFFQGVLDDPLGIYTGDFVNGLKDGKGVYDYRNGMLYEGQYKNGKKEGKGKILNYNRSVAYEGNFANDLPNGKGYVLDENGNQIYAIFKDGLDELTLQS